MPDPPVPGPGRELYLGDKLRLDPAGVPGISARDLDKGRAVAPVCFQLGDKLPAHGRAEACPDPAGEDQPTAVVVAHHQRTEVVIARRVALLDCSL
jgi:hypothetical protein